MQLLYASFVPPSASAYLLCLYCQALKQQCHYQSVINGIYHVEIQLAALSNAHKKCVTTSTKAACLTAASDSVQRALLEKLTGLISTPVGDAVPAGVVALESMRLIVEVVGEVSSEEVHQMRQPCITKLIASPQPLKAQVRISTACLSNSLWLLLCMSQS